MGAPTLSWTNLFVDDLDSLPTFYMDVFGFEEIPEMRNPVFRGISTGRTNIGFMSPAVYGVLELEDESATAGVSFLLNVEVESTDEVDRLTEAAVAAGATLRMPAFMTGYGWYLSVLLDPERNVLRIAKVVHGPSF
jgi:predicted enzyme related to lactoylglutathione lyase